MRQLSLGYRANNPMDVTSDPTTLKNDPWVGQVGVVYSSDSSHCFAVFDSVANGVRCGAHVVLGYQKNDGINTLQGLVDRFAPSSDNNPSDYAAELADYVGRGKDESISFDEYLETICRGIVQREQSLDLVTDAEYTAGIQSARSAFGLA